MQDVPSSEVPPKLPFRGESSGIAMQVNLRRAQPSPVPYTHQPYANEPPSGRLASGATEAKRPFGHLLVENVFRGGESDYPQSTEIPPRLQAFGVAPTLGANDATLAQGMVNIGRLAEVSGCMASCVRVQVLAMK
ncbi:hypothetical protein NCCNTM_48430 [Mycolicibacterium sp. NCC-Tsukiji]|nr:hypothetical protein NCCNTM_48430 [Mycolicibacterium sp. NCC-Tsukiji]